MSLSKEKLGKIVGFSAVCGGLALWLWTRRRSQLKLNHPKTSNNAVLKTHVNASIDIVTTPEQWELCVPRLVEDSERTKVLGIDCEWLPRSNNPVALLQIATDSGYCVLVRLCLMDRTKIPQSLKTILADKSIIKVGVGVYGDALRLLTDYALKVNGCVDLRDVLQRVRGVFQCERMGLQGLAKGVLGVHILKDPRIRCGNWEAARLNQAQMEYAAMDAIVGADIFASLVLAKITGKDLRDDPEAAAAVALETRLTMARSLCQGIVDSGKFVDPNFKPRQGRNKPTNASSSRKESGEAFGVRKRPLWDNCELVAPDGEQLCTCDARKAAWYISKGLGEKISDDPLVVRLNFEPSGRPKSERNYYLQQKENQCVVCGACENYARKFIVPQEYRKYFPLLLKEHTSHDVLLMCPPCHRVSSSHDGSMRMQLANQCGAPLNSGENSNVYKDFDLQQVKSAGRALKFNRTRMPEARVEELERVLYDYFGVPEITEDCLDKAAELDIKQVKTDYIIHGQQVVRHFTEHSSLLEFQATWRRHFVLTMEPKFLPAYWAVDYVPENWGRQGGESEEEEEEEGKGGRGEDGVSFEDVPGDQFSTEARGENDGGFFLSDSEEEDDDDDEEEDD